MPANDIAPRFDLSAGERGLLEQAETIAAAHAPVDGESMSLAALRGIFRELEVHGLPGFGAAARGRRKRIIAAGIRRLGRGSFPRSYAARQS